MAADGRFRWIVETMLVRPDDRILEIGPGSGDSLAYLAERLRNGHVVGVDRSPTAIARAAKRHAAYIDSGRVSLLQAGMEQLRREQLLEEIGPDATGFDIVFAVNVNLFWTKRPTTELALIRDCLAEDGKFYLFYGYGQPDARVSTSPKPTPGHLIDYLTQAAFDVDVVSSGDLLGIVATPR
ncbi:class I SAM-dependent methyltransferase [Nocardia sp. GCM10030253]|uniref:class I SAM-dependent methyltransferase n=1 Tax=Nocardia sp. GCM10030253 TaxID=3273404 RepID=UPI0036313B9B